MESQDKLSVAGLRYYRQFSHFAHRSKLATQYGSAFTDIILSSGPHVHIMSYQTKILWLTQFLEYR